MLIKPHFFNRVLQIPGLQHYLSYCIWRYSITGKGLHDTKTTNRGENIIGGVSGFYLDLYPLEFPPINLFLLILNFKITSFGLCNLLSHDDFFLHSNSESDVLKMLGILNGYAVMKT